MTDAAKPTAKRTSRSSEDAAMKSRTEADIAFVEALARVLRENDLAEIAVSREFGDHELEVRLSRTVAVEAVATAAPLAAPAPTLSLPQAETVREAAAAPAEDLSNAVTAPMVGTVYLAPEPDASNYVSEGDTVTEGQTLLIIEAMKTMNHIPSPKSGVVRRVLVSNAQPVEYGAPLLVIS